MSQSLLLFENSTVRVGFCNILNTAGRIFYEDIHNGVSHFSTMPNGTEVSAEINPNAYFLFVVVYTSRMQYCFFVSTKSGRYVYIDNNGNGNVTNLAVNNIMNMQTLEFIGVSIVNKNLLLGNTVVGKMNVISVKKIYFNINNMYKLAQLESSRSVQSPYIELAEVLSSFQYTADQQLQHSGFTSGGYVVLPMSSEEIGNIINAVMTGTGVLRTDDLQTHYAMWDNCKSRKPTYLLLIGSSGIGKTYTMRSLAKHYKLKNPVYLSYDNPMPYFPDYMKLANFELRFAGSNVVLHATEPNAHVAHYEQFADVMEKIGVAARNNKLDIVSEKADLNGVTSLIQLYRDHGYDVRIGFKPVTDRNQRYNFMYRRFLSEEGRYGRLDELDSSFEALRTTLLANGMEYRRNLKGVEIFAST